MEKDGYAVVVADAQQKAQKLVQTAEQRKQRVEEEAIIFHRFQNFYNYTP